MTTKPANPAQTLGLALAAALAIGALGAPAAAQPAPGVGLLAAMDANGDAAISRAEAIAARERMFDRIDRNGDDVVTQDEVQALREMIRDTALMLDVMARRAAERLDRSGDQAVSREEFTARLRLFEIADRNDDDMLDSAEISRIEAIMKRR